MDTKRFKIRKENLDKALTAKALAHTIEYHFSVEWGLFTGENSTTLSGKFEQAAFLETDKNGKKRLEKHSLRTYLKICSSKRRISVAFIRSWRAFNISTRHSNVCFDSCLALTPREPTRLSFRPATLPTPREENAGATEKEKKIWIKFYCLGKVERTRSFCCACCCFIRCAKVCLHNYVENFM